MAKTKWIVPAVALVLCAVSLIGAGYAAYTATLTDNESATVDNNFIVMSVGTRTLGAEVNIYYDSTVTYTNGDNAVSIYYPYLDKDTTETVTKVSIGTIVVNADETNVGTEVTSDGYKVAVSNLSLTGVTLTGYAVKIYKDAELTQEVTSETVMAYGATLYVALFYEQTGSKDGVSTAPAATGTIGYTLTATANLN